MYEQTFDGKSNNCDTATHTLFSSSHILKMAEIQQGIRVRSQLESF